MKEMIRYGLTLAVICAAASGLLAMVNHVTGPRILAQAGAQEDSSLSELLPQASRFEPVNAAGGLAYYKGYDKDNKFAGIVFKASGKGYSSDIESLVGMAKGGRVTGIKITSLNETPGLGSKVAEPDFLSLFKGKDTSQLPQVQAITGATISSSAVIKSVSKKAAELEEQIKNEK